MALCQNRDFLSFTSTERRARCGGVAAHEPKGTMSETFRPYPFRHVLSGAVALGLANAAAISVPAGLISLVMDGHRLAVWQWVAYSAASGLFSCVLDAVAGRPLQYAQRTNTPHGPAPTLTMLASPLIGGGASGLIVAGRPWFIAGGLCAFVGFLPYVFALRPWEYTDDELIKEQSKEFAQVTRRYVQDYQDDLGELTRKRAQRKHEKNQERLAKKRRAED